MTDKREKPSFESVNYVLRPKKQIERKIIIEILREIDEKINLGKYLYIGFGSIYYYDFILLHKFLGIRNLQSIDDKTPTKRFEFNRPYDFILFENKASTDFLSAFDWKQGVVLWLDYDQQLNNDILADLKIVANNCKRKDILIVTVNASCETDRVPRKESRKEFYHNFRKYISPKYTHRRYFTRTRLPKLLQNVITNYIKTVCADRAALKFFKLFAFKYRDTAPMFTIGGIFDRIDELCDWENEFICRTEEITNINVPNLTYCEKFWMDSHLEAIKRAIKTIQRKVKKDMQISDATEQKEIMTKMINEQLAFELGSIDDWKNYIRYYRYYPQYYEGLI